MCGWWSWCGRGSCHFSDCQGKNEKEKETEWHFVDSHLKMQAKGQGTPPGRWCHLYLENESLTWFSHPSVMATEKKQTHGWKKMKCATTNLLFPPLQNDSMFPMDPQLGLQLSIMLICNSAVTVLKQWWLDPLSFSLSKKKDMYLYIYYICI